MESTSQDSRLICSVFAGRIADTGIDPVICMKECLSIMKHNLNLNSCGQPQGTDKYLSG